MSKIQNHSKLSARQNIATKKKSKITNINLNKNSTYKISPQCFRMTEDDIIVLNNFRDKIIQKTGKPYTKSKIIRGLVHMIDQLEIELIEKSIDNYT